jgi:hypothetical protein
MARQTLITCMFCGDEGVPQGIEDVLPRWLSGKLAHYARDARRAAINAGQLDSDVGDEPSYTDYRYDKLDNFWHDLDERSTTRSSSRVQTGARPGPYRLPEVCRECNHGWMSRLEEAAGRIIPGLMDGVTKRLTSFDQYVLATWTIKTCLTYDAALTPRLISAGDGSRLLFKYGYAIPGSSVALGDDDGYLPDGAFVHSRALLGSDRSVVDVDAAKFQFQFNRVILQAIVNIGRQDDDRVRGFAVNVREQDERLWPLQERAIDWPRVT